MHVWENQKPTVKRHTWGRHIVTKNSGVSMSKPLKQWLQNMCVRSSKIRWQQIRISLILLQKEQEEEEIFIPRTNDSHLSRN